MTRTKIIVTLDPKLAAELRQAGGPRGLSAFVNEAIRQQLQAARLRRMLGEMEGETGPIPEDIRREVDSLPWPG